MVDDRFFKLSDDDILKYKKERMNMSYNFHVFRKMKNEGLLTEKEFIEAIELLEDQCQTPTVKFLLEGWLEDYKEGREECCP